MAARKIQNYCTHWPSVSSINLPEGSSFGTKTPAENDAFPTALQFTVVYRKGSSLHLADTLPKAPCQDRAAAPSVPDTFQVFRLHLAHLDPRSLALTDSTRKQLNRATVSYQDMQQLKQYILHIWPPTWQQIPPDLLAFWHFWWRP